jgi:hypothetical protein
MIEIAKSILEVAKGLFGLQGEFGKARRDRRQRLATYFADLASLIEEVSASLRINQYPHGSCAQLHALASMMKRTVKGIVADADAQAYQDKLMQVWQIEQLYSEFQSASAKRTQTDLNRLDEAAGYFRAVAAHLRVV